jgi:hypothetical protein
LVLQANFVGMDKGFFTRQVRQKRKGRKMAADNMGDHS